MLQVEQTNLNLALSLIRLNKKKPSSISKGLLNCLTIKLTKNKCYDKQIYVFCYRLV